MIVFPKRLVLASLLAAVFSAPAVPAFAQDIPSEALLATDMNASAAPAKAAALTLDQALAWALEESPVLGASRSRADAATASRSQAGALPNPELSIEAENIYGDYDGTDQAEITYGIEQLVELPGKRSSRVRMAESEKTRIHYERDAAGLDLIRDITIAYAELAAAQQELSILEEEQVLAKEVRDSVVAKVEAGKEPPIQKNKAQIELSASEIALDRARRAASAKKQALAALMGGDTGNFTVRADDMPVLKEPETLESYRARLPQTPDARSLLVNVAQAQSALSFEKANAFPDPTLGFGVKKFREDDTEAFVAGVSFPIPVFNLNRAGIKRAGHELSAVEMEQRSGTLALEAALAETYGNYLSAYREAGALKTTLLPGAEEAFEFARGGYDAGKFGYLEVLDAQRTLFDARKQLNEAILECHRQRAMLERLTAVHAHENISDKE